MAEGTKWEFELLDKASANAAHIDKAVTGLHESMEKSVFNAELLAKGFEKLVDKVMEFGKELVKDTLRAADFDRTNRITFKAITGSAAKAEEALESMNDVAMRGAIPIRELAPAWTKLMNAGFSDEQTRKIAATARDMSLLTGHPEAVGSWAEKFAEIKNAGTMAGRSLMQFRDVANMDVLARKLLGAGKSAKDLAGGFRDAKINADRLIPALMEAVAARTHGDAGKLSMDYADGWEGAITRVENAWDHLLGEFSKTQEFKQLTDLAQEFAKWLGSPQAASIFKDVAFSISSMALAFADLAKSLNQIAPLGDIIHNTLGGGLGEKLFKHIEEMQDKATTGWLAKGPSGKWYEVGKDGVARPIVEGTKDGLGIHSPSKVFEDLGDYSAQGFQRGFGMSDPLAMTPAPRVGGGSGGKGHSISLNLTVNVGGGDHGDSHGLAEAVREEVLNALTGAMEELAIEAGA